MSQHDRNIKHLFKQTLTSKTGNFVGLVVTAHFMLFCDLPYFSKKSCLTFHAKKRGKKSIGRCFTCNIKVDTHNNVKCHILIFEILVQFKKKNKKKTFSLRFKKQREKLNFNCGTLKVTPFNHLPQKDTFYPFANRADPVQGALVRAA